MDIRKAAKAVMGGVSAIAATGTTVFATVPEGVDMPWYAWLALAMFNAGVAIVVVYYIPNKTAT